MRQRQSIKREGTHARAAISITRLFKIEKGPRGQDDSSDDVDADDEVNEVRGARSCPKYLISCAARARALVQLKLFARSRRAITFSSANGWFARARVRTPPSSTRVWLNGENPLAHTRTIWLQNGQLVRGRSSLLGLRLCTRARAPVNCARREWAPHNSGAKNSMRLRRSL